jgi:short-subunit dehydrogenase
MNPDEWYHSIPLLTQHYTITIHSSTASLQKTPALLDCTKQFVTRISKQLRLELQQT